MSNNAEASNFRTSDRIAWVFRWGLLGCAALFGITLVGWLIISRISFSGPRWIFEWMGITTLVSLGGSFLFGLARLFLVITCQLQARLNEWLLTFVVSGFFMALIRLILIGDAMSLEPGNLLPALILMGLVTLTLLLGSSWAWRTTKILRIEKGYMRIGYLCVGWFLALGVASATLLLLMKLFYFSFRSNHATMTWYLFLGAMSFLAVPGVLIEMRTRLKSKLHAPPME